MRDKRTIPDCFSCGTSQDVCPTRAVALGTGRRTRPPQPWAEFKIDAKSRHKSRS